VLKNLKYYLKLYLLFTKFAYQTVLQARLGIVFFMGAKLVRFAFFYFFILIIFSRKSDFGGYTFDQAILFYLTFNVIDTAAQVLFREVYRFRPQVLSGSFDLTLLKPHHPFIRILLGGGDVLDLSLLLPYLLLALFFAFKITSVTALSLISYLILIGNALLIATAFHIIVLALGILTTEVDHTIMIYRDITIMGRFPFDIYKEPLRSIFTFLIPIGIMMSFPPYALFKLLSSVSYLVSFLVSSLLLIASFKLWNYALKKYQSWGG
jgi:ABC-2 type transport system permease protein